MVNIKGIRAFLHDAKAVSPAIATLILIVIAAVAAAGVGILVQSSQKNAQDQTANKDMSVNGEFSIKGSTTVLPLSQAEITAFQNKYPAVTINLGGGGSGTGRALVFNKQVDVGASSDLWPDGAQSDSATGLNYDGREKAVIQGAGMDSWIYETKVGTGMIVIGGNVKIGTDAITTINIINSTGVSTNSGSTLNITYGDLQKAYNSSSPTVGKITVGGTDIKVVQRADDSGTEETFSRWISGDSKAKQLAVDTTTVPGYQGNQGVRDAIAATGSNTIGFLDVGFTGKNANGNVNVVAATMDSAAGPVIADGTTKGVGKTYDVASKFTAGGAAKPGLARDLYYYSQGVPSGAVQAYLNFVLSNDGQTIVEKTGFYRP